MIDYGIDYDANLILPEGKYSVMLSNWKEKKTVAKGTQYASLIFEIYSGPFTGRFIYRALCTNSQLANFMLLCNKPYVAQTTARQALDSLLNTHYEVTVSHKHHPELSETFLEITGLEPRS